ncbi:hypothetical protein Hanom_Chr08g00753971 [Helianthus anomalus]
MVILKYMPNEALLLKVYDDVAGFWWRLGFDSRRLIYLNERLREKALEKVRSHFGFSRGDVRVHSVFRNY